MDKEKWSSYAPPSQEPYIRAWASNYSANLLYIVQYQPNRYTLHKVLTSNPACAGPFETLEAAKVAHALIAPLQD